METGIQHGGVLAQDMPSWMRKVSTRSRSPIPPPFSFLTWSSTPFPIVLPSRERGGWGVQKTRELESILKSKPRGVHFHLFVPSGSEASVRLRPPPAAAIRRS